MAAVIGGCVAGLAATLAYLLWHGLYLVFEDVLAWREARRIRRQHLTTCRSIDALGTTTHPKE
ncbi:hypothetical protein ACFVP3_23400 [Streptomyces sp. NPDC057806]|uniref:hypothetical protein n=1 Tax=Streptomyces sp. NPDC057806 TaxID=3346255 RepID=UPI00367369F3